MTARAVLGGNPVGTFFVLLTGLSATATLAAWTCAVDAVCGTVHTLRLLALTVVAGVFATGLLAEAVGDRLR